MNHSEKEESVKKCKYCGRKQGWKKKTLCWIVHNCCSYCWRKYHRSTPRKTKKKKIRQSCKKCGAVRTRYSSSICWKENLCGLCWKSIYNPKTVAPQYKLCSKCGLPMSALRIQAHHLSYNIGDYFCRHCKLIHLSGNNSVYNPHT